MQIDKIGKFTFALNLKITRLRVSGQLRVQCFKHVLSKSLVFLLFSTSVMMDSACTLGHPHFSPILLILSDWFYYFLSIDECFVRRKRPRVISSFMWLKKALNKDMLKSEEYLIILVLILPRRIIPKLANWSTERLSFSLIKQYTDLNFIRNTVTWNTESEESKRNSVRPP